MHLIPPSLPPLRQAISVAAAVLLLASSGCDFGSTVHEAGAVAEKGETPQKTTEPEEAELPPGPPKVSKDEIRRARKAYLSKLNEGRALTKNKEYAKALALYREALEIEPDNPAVLGELGWAAFLSKDLPLATRTTNMGLRYSRKDRQRGMLLYNLGRVAEEQGHKELAAEHYRASLLARPNETVEARLASLNAPPPEVSRGLEFVARGLTDMDAVCVELKTRCDEIIMFGNPQEDCHCETIGAVDQWEEGGKTKTAALVRIGDGGDEWDGANFAVHLVLSGKEGLDVTDFLGWAYNPGAFGIWEGLRKPVLTRTQLLKGDDSEFLIEFEKDRFDRDMGLNEFEVEAHHLTVACAHLDGVPRCTRPLIRHYGYERDVEFEDEEFADEEFEHTKGLPIKESFDATIEFQEDGTLKVRSEGVGDQAADGFMGIRLETGDHALEDLL